MRQTKEQMETEYQKWLQVYTDSHTQIDDLLVMAKDVNRMEGSLAILPELLKSQAVMDEALYRMETIAKVLRADYIR